MTYEKGFLHKISFFNRFLKNYIERMKTTKNLPQYDYVKFE